MGGKWIAKRSSIKISTPNLSVREIPEFYAYQAFHNKIQNNCQAKPPTKESAKQEHHQQNRLHAKETKSKKGSDGKLKM